MRTNGEPRSQRFARARRAVRRTFKDWEEEIARPVLVAVASALALFVFALPLAPVRRFLFGDTVAYPIYCTAETYSTSLGSARTEFLLINTTKDDLTRSDLEEKLKAASESFRPATPDLTLRYERHVGTVVRAESDPSNEGKGFVDVARAAPGSSDVKIRVKSISGRAILRVVIDVTGLDSVEITRAAHGAVPFGIEDYERACYSR